MIISRGFDLQNWEARTEIEAEVRKIDESAGTLETPVSNRNIDRYRSIILPRGAEPHMHNYRANPVFVWQHDSNKILGRAEQVVTTDDEVTAGFKFDLKSRFAANTFRLYAEGYLRAFSPRTRAHKVFFAWDSPRIMAELEVIDREAYQHLSEGRCDYVIAEHEYLEISACTIPGNAGALRRAFRDGVVEREFAAEMMGRIVPTHHPVNFPRKETEDEMTAEQQKQIVDQVTEQVAARVAELLPKPPAPAETERRLTDKQKDEIASIARQAALEVFSEVLSAE